MLLFQINRPDLVESLGLFANYVFWIRRNKRILGSQLFFIFPPARSSILILVIFSNVVQPPPPEPHDPASATHRVAVEPLTASPHSNFGVITCGACTPGVCYAVPCAVCCGGSQSKMPVFFHTLNVGNFWVAKIEEMARYNQISISRRSPTGFCEV